MNMSQSLKNTNIALSTYQKNNLTLICNNKQIAQLSHLSLNEIKKLLQIQDSLIIDSHTKKQATKIIDLISNKLQHKTSIKYLQLCLTLEKDKQAIEQKRQALALIPTDIPNEWQKKCIQLLQQLKKCTTKINFTQTLLTTQETIRQELEQLELPLRTVTEEQLQEFAHDNSILIITDSLTTSDKSYSKDEFIALYKGTIIAQNKQEILSILDFLNEDETLANKLIQAASSFMQTTFPLLQDYQPLYNKLKEQQKQDYKDLITKALKLEETVANINCELKDILTKQTVQLSGDDLVNLLGNNQLTALQDKIKDTIKHTIQTYEQELLKSFNQTSIICHNIFANESYPLEIDKQSQNELLEKLEQQAQAQTAKATQELGIFDLLNITKLWDIMHAIDVLTALHAISQTYELKPAQLTTQELCIESGKHLFIANPTPITYGIGTKKKLLNTQLNEEKIAIITGANSGGKTTLLELLIQCQLLTHFGLGIPADQTSHIPLLEEIVYLKKFTGTAGSGAFEQTIRSLLKIIESPSKKLLLIDEFEAVTEPGAAAKILVAVLEFLTKTEHLCVAVSHLGVEIEHLIKTLPIRLDGISAEGLHKNGKLITTHQPQFYTLGKSTPELILKKILQDTAFVEKHKTGAQLLKSLLEK